MANIYFCESGTADSYILLVTDSGIYASSCSPDGRFAGISLHLDERETAEGKAAEILAAMDEPAESLADMADDMDKGGWMGDALTDIDGRKLTLDDLIREDESREPWQRDTRCKII